MPANSPGTVRCAAAVRAACAACIWVHETCTCCVGSSGDHLSGRACEARAAHGGRGHCGRGAHGREVVVGCGAWLGACVACGVRGSRLRCAAVRARVGWPHRCALLLCVCWRGCCRRRLSPAAASRAGAGATHARRAPAASAQEVSDFLPSPPAGTMLSCTLRLLRAWRGGGATRVGWRHRAARHYAWR